jgi:ParB-like chromosome segregation protein Spo0J
MAFPSDEAYRDPGEVPVLDWIDKNLIDIDPSYQRGLDEVRVGKILDWFAWKSFGAIVVAPSADGRYNCIDGQHRLEAAKRHPKVAHVPAVIIAVQGTVGEAETFVAVNADRRNVSPLEMHWAKLAAEDPEAVTVAQVVERAGITILRYPASNGNFKPRETIAISAIRSLIDRRGAMRARQMLEVLAKADLTPITAHQIKAVELLLTDAEFREHIEPEALTDAIMGKALALDDDAAAFAATHRMPKWRALASVWFKRSRKRRQPARVAA